VLDLFERGSVHTNLVTPDSELVELFAGYWSIALPSFNNSSLAYPFYHLKTSTFWHLVAVPGQEQILESGGPFKSVNQLERVVQGVQLDVELYEALQDKSTRDVLRRILIQTYFADDIQACLEEQSIVNLLSFEYGEKLLDYAKTQPSLSNDVQIEPPASRIARKQGFRYAVVGAYQHRCALCGVRVLTSIGHTAVDAAHIIPWSETHNDDPRNGIALCGLCHWVFDEGLMAISEAYIVKLSPQMRVSDNIPGHMLTLEHRSIIGPNERALWPDLQSINWHSKNIFQNT
jgi:putative restriction endonuclease